MQPPQEHNMNKIKFSLRVTEVYTFADAIIHLYQESAPNDETLAKDTLLASMISEMKSISDELSVAIKSDRAESSLDEADIARDKLIRNLADLITGYAAIPIPEKQAAGSRLLSIFKKYGRGMVQKSYAEESALIESMLVDFSAESAKADIELLEGVGILISSLRAAQDEFRIASAAFTKAVAGKTRSASEIKKGFLDLINSQFVTYLCVLKKIPAYADFIAKCTVEIARANSPANVRSKAASGETAKGAENAKDSGENESSADSAAEEERQ